MKSLFSLILSFLLLTLSSCNENNEKLKQEEIKDWMEISDFLDSEVESNIYLIRQKLEKPVSFLQIAEDDRREAYKLFKILDTSLIAIKEIQNEIKDIHYSKSSPMVKNGKVTEHFFKISENGRQLSSTIIWTLNNLNTALGKPKDAEFKNSFKILPELIYRHQYFQEEFKNIAVPVALTKLTSLKRELLQYLWLNTGDKLEILTFGDHSPCVGAVPIVTNDNDCIRVGEEQNINIFLAYFFASSYLEMYSTAILDTGIRPKQNEYKKLNINSGRGEFKIKPTSTGRKQIYGKIKYLLPDGKYEELFLQKQFTVIK